MKNPFRHLFRKESKNSSVATNTPGLTRQQGLVFADVLPCMRPYVVGENTSGDSCLRGQVDNASGYRSLHAAISDIEDREQCLHLCVKPENFFLFFSISAQVILDRFAQAIEEAPPARPDPCVQGYEYEEYEIDNKAVILCHLDNLLLLEKLFVALPQYTTYPPYGIEIRWQDFQRLKKAFKTRGQ